MPTMISECSKALNLQPPQNMIIVPTGLETLRVSRYKDQGLIYSSIVAPNTLSYMSEYDIYPDWGYAPDYTKYLINVGNNNSTLTDDADKLSTNNTQMVDINKYQPNQTTTHIIRANPYKCHYPECDSRGGYKQKGHLVRHIST